MMKYIYFRKLYTRVTHENEGYQLHSIIIFNKYPWMYHARVLREDEDTSQGNVQRVVTQWRYRIKIDLWIVVMDFAWNGRKPKNTYEENK